MINFEHWRKSVVTCPHCDYEHKDGMEGYEYVPEDEVATLTCDACESDFELLTHYEFKFTTRKDSTEEWP